MDALSDHRQLAAQIFDAFRQPCLILDDDARIRHVNQAFLERFEVDPSPGQSVRDLKVGPFAKPTNASPPFAEQIASRIASGEIEVDMVYDQGTGPFAAVRSWRTKLKRLEPTIEPRWLLVLEEIADVGAGDGRLARQALEATLLHRVANAVGATPHLEDALVACVDIVCEMAGWPIGHICLVDSGNPDRLISTDLWREHEISSVRSSNEDGERRSGSRAASLRLATRDIELGRNDDLPTRIWQSGEPAWIVDLQDAKFRRAEAARQAGVAGAFGFPIKIKGETVAVLEFFSERPMAPDRSLLATVRGLGEQIGRIIERSRVEAALRRSEQELSELFDHAAVGLMFLSPDGIVQRANRELLEILGCLSHELVGRPIREFLVERAAVEQIDKCCREGCTLTGFETRLRARDGVLRHVLLDANARMNDGKVEYLRCFARDISDRHRNEAERARLAAIVQSSDDAIIGLSADGIVTSWNPGAERLYGYGSDEVAGGSISIIIPQEREEEMTRLLETVKRGERIEQYETTRIHRSGRRIDVSVTVSPILSTVLKTTAGPHDHEPVDCQVSADNYAADNHTNGWNDHSQAEGQDGSRVANPHGTSAARHGNGLDETPGEAEGLILGVAMIERDISERKRVAAEIRRIMQEAERANRAKGEFLANVSHELRTPMNAIIGMTELSLDEPVPARVRDYLETSQDSAEVLLRLLNDILDFSRMEAGRFDLDEVKFNLREMLDETVKTHAIRAHERGLEMALSMPADVPHNLVGDPVRLRQILSNLIGNAIKFTETGEIVVGVKTVGKHEGDVELHFHVQDTGVGIAPSEQDRIFAPFAQVDATSTRHHGGAGLGLAICRELTAMMGGRLWLESQVGVGTTFHFVVRFGLQPDRMQDSAPPHIRELKGLPVLVVDDNGTNRRILEDTLRSWQMQPDVVASAEEAMAALRRAAEADSVYPLVIVDGLMPGTDGFTLVEQIKNDENLAAATVLMLSSADRRLFRERCDRLDIAAYLEKPVTQSELLDTIVAAMQVPPLERDTSDQSGRIVGTSEPLSILLVEDTPANRKVVTAVLTKRGHKVTIAVDGRQAVDLFKQHRDFDIVLMDVQMPNMDGFQATGIIRTIEQSQGDRVPIIAMTAHAMRGDRERCIAAGMDAYLSKPIDVRRMLRLIERIASRRRRLATTPSGNGETVAAAEASTGNPAADLASTATGEQEPSAVGEEQGDQAASPPIYSRSDSLERLGGDEQLLREIAQFFFEDSDKLLASIDHAVARSDWQNVRIAAHSLKGLAAHFSAVRAVDAARELEYAANDSEGDRVRSLVEPLHQEVERLCEALTEITDSGKPLVDR